MMPQCMIYWVCINKKGMKKFTHTHIYIDDDNDASYLTLKISKVLFK